MTIHMPPGPDGVVKRAFTADDVRRMVEAEILDEGEHVELVDGELIETPAKGFAHDRVKNALVRRLARALPDHLYVATESTLQLGPAFLLEPDILVARSDSVIASEEGFATVGAGGALLVIEVALSSASYDRDRKARVYADHGVPEYWVLDLNERAAVVHRGPSPAGYAEIQTHGPETLLQPTAPELHAVSVRLADLDL
jgi:Uma2 family endonuclease